MITNPMPDTEPCDMCKRLKDRMVAMAPGPDGKPWWLCVKCWCDGIMTPKEPPATLPPPRTKKAKAA